MLVRDVINIALRKLGRLGSGREPRQADQQDALEAFRGLYSSWIASGAFGRLSDVIPKTNYTAGENERVFRTQDATLEITLPETVSQNNWPLPYNLERDTYQGNYEGAIGNARTPRDGSVVVISDSFTGLTLSFIYDTATQAWQNVSELQLSDNAPRSASDPMGLASCLAIEISDQFSGELQPATLQQAARYAQAATHRYSMPRATSYGSYY